MSTDALILSRLLPRITIARFLHGTLAQVRTLALHGRPLPFGLHTFHLVWFECHRLRGAR